VGLSWWCRHAGIDTITTIITTITTVIIAIEIERAGELTARRATILKIGSGVVRGEQDFTGRPSTIGQKTTRLA
jgi:hypothetical protein